jgi:hypothetical protein
MSHPASTLGDEPAVGDLLIVSTEASRPKSSERPAPTLWSNATRAGGNDSDPAAGVSPLSDGSAIVTGRFAGTATFGTNITLIIDGGTSDVFVANFNASGP